MKEILIESDYKMNYMIMFKKINKFKSYYAKISSCSPFQILQIHMLDVASNIIFNTSWQNHCHHTCNISKQRRSRASHWPPGCQTQLMWQGSSLQYRSSCRRSASGSSGPGRGLSWQSLRIFWLGHIAGFLWYHLHQGFLNNFVSLKM